MFCSTLIFLSYVTTTVWDGRRPSFDTPRSVISLRNTAEHLRRRKPWNKAFNSANVKQYEPVMANRLGQLYDKLQKVAEGPEKKLDLAGMLSFFAYVVILLHRFL